MKFQSLFFIKAFSYAEFGVNSFLGVDFYGKYDIVSMVAQGKMVPLAGIKVSS